MLKPVLIVLLLSISVFSSIPNLDYESEVYISTSTSAYMQITSNPSTGYMWLMIPPNSAKFKVEDIDGEYSPPTNSMPGAPGYQLFRVDCTELCQDGDSILLLLEYRRSWEPEPVARKEVTIIVSSEPRVD